MISRRSLVLASILLVGTALFAAAHRPVAIGGGYPTYDQALLVTDIDVSQVAYAKLTESAPALWLVFEAEAGTPLDISLGVPVLDRLSGYRPNLAVLGPGLPLIHLPFELPPGVGATIFDSAGAAPRFFHEPFTGTDSWILVEETTVLPESGSYFVVAWIADGPPDKLWVSIGRREQFGLRDVLALPTILRDVRAFHEVLPGPSALATAAKVLFLALVGAVIAILV